MNILPAVYYFFVIAIAVWTIHSALKLARQYRLDFLRTYSLSIMAFTGYGFLNFTGQVFLIQIVPAAGFTLEIGNLIVFTLAIPLGVLWLYFYLGFFARLCLIPIPRAFSITFWAVNAVLIMSNFRAIATLLATRGSSPAPSTLLWNVPIYLGIFLCTSIAAIVLSRRFQNPFGRKFIRTMAALYLAGFCGLVLLGDVLNLPFYADRFRFLAFLSTVYFLINILPLIYLSRSLKEHFNELSGIDKTPDEPLVEFAETFRLTRREVEIMELVINGFKNEDVANALHISPQTVKNNVSAIFRKTGVKNRVQLGNILRNYEDQAE